MTLNNKERKRRRNRGRARMPTIRPRSLGGELAEHAEILAHKLYDYVEGQMLHTVAEVRQ